MAAAANIESFAVVDRRADVALFEREGGKPGRRIEVGERSGGIAKCCGVGGDAVREIGKNFKFEIKRTFAGRRDLAFDF